LKKFFLTLEVFFKPQMFVLTIFFKTLNGKILVVFWKNFF